MAVTSMTTLLPSPLFAKFDEKLNHSSLYFVLCPKLVAPIDMWPKRDKVSTTIADEGVVIDKTLAEKLPPRLTRTESSGTTTSEPEESTVWNQPYRPRPVVDQSTILLFGFIAFALAWVWPPLILVVTYILSILIPYSFRTNDDAAHRRQLYAQFMREADLPKRVRCLPKSIHLEDEFWVNPRGMLLNTLLMTPKHVPVRAVVCFCHGYSGDVSFLKRADSQRLVQSGIAFVAIEYEGHGLSDGPLGLFNDWGTLIDDVALYFQQITSRRFPGLPIFIMGESMGGAVAYCVYNRMPSAFRGVVFVAPMCKISDDMLPPQWAIRLLRWLIGPASATSFLGHLPIAPAKQSLDDLSQSDTEKRHLSLRSPLNYGRKPRLATARELMDATQQICTSLHDFDASFLVLHGKADRVTDYRLSEALYNESKSKDKEIRLYDDMWHGLLSGEPDANTDTVYRDIISWILERS